MYSQIDPRLSHLNAEQIEELITQYYAGEDISSLIQEFQVECLPQKLHKLLPPQILHHVVCPHCHTAMVFQRPARTSNRFSRKKVLCLNCGHIGEGSCNCQGCALERERLLERERQEKQSWVTEFCRKMQPAPPAIESVEELTLRQAVALLALTRACMYLQLPEVEGFDPNEVHLNPLKHATVPFAPGMELGIRLIQELVSCRLMYVSEFSDPSAFVLNQDNFEGVQFESAVWKVRGNDPQKLIYDIARYAANGELWPPRWRDEVESLWLDIAFAEAKEYFLYQAKQRELPDVSGKSLDAMLKNLLQDYSVSQCYRVIYAGAREAADFLVRTKCTRKHAGNYMIGACQRWADHARAEHWDVAKYKRNYVLPRTMIDYVFFDTFLKVGDMGFKDNPKIVDLHAITRWYV